MFGTVSRLLLPRLLQIPFDPLPVAAFASLMVLLFTEHPLSLLPWAIVFPHIIDAARGGRQAWFQWVFANPIVLWLGRISYSIYLAHFVGLSVAVYLFATLLPGISQPMLVAGMTLAIIPIVAVAGLSFRFIEQPGIALGRVLARRLRGAHAEQIEALPISSVASRALGSRS